MASPRQTRASKLNPNTPLSSKAAKKQAAAAAAAAAIVAAAATTTGMSSSSNPTTPASSTTPVPPSPIPTPPLERFTLPDIPIVKEIGSDGTIIWNEETEPILFRNVLKLKPVGPMKHWRMLLVRKRVSQALNYPVSSHSIWNHLQTLFDMKALDEMETLDKPEKIESFSLPKSFQELKQMRTGVVKKSGNKAKKQEEGKGTDDYSSSSELGRDSPSSLREMSDTPTSSTSIEVKSSGPGRKKKTVSESESTSDSKSSVKDSGKSSGKRGSVSGKKSLDSSGKKTPGAQRKASDEGKDPDSPSSELGDESPSSREMSDTPTSTASTEAKTPVKGRKKKTVSESESLTGSTKKEPGKPGRKPGKKSLDSNVKKTLKEKEEAKTTGDDDDSSSSELGRDSPSSLRDMSETRTPTPSGEAKGLVKIRKRKTVSESESATSQKESKAPGKRSSLSVKKPRNRVL